MISSTSNSKSAGNLILRIALLGLIVIAINQLVIASLPFAWGEIPFNNRFNFYQANKEEFDTIFIGSSRTHRQIDPEIFDNQLASIAPSNSFNLGAGANFFPKTYRTFREVLADKPERLKTIIFEFTVTRILPQPENWHTLEQTYWSDRETVQYLLQSTWNEDIDFADKLLYSGVHIGTFLEKNLNFGFGVDILSFIFNDHYKYDNYLGPNRDGYYSADDEMAYGTPTSQQNLARRREGMLDAPNRFAIIVDNSTKFYQDPDLWKPYDPIYLARLQQMQMMAKDAGVELFFVLQPRLGRSYDHLMPLFNELPSSNRIEIVDPEKYPEFYDQDNSFDQGHLNKATSEKFTRILAREFIALLE